MQAGIEASIPAGNAGRPTLFDDDRVVALTASLALVGLSASMGFPTLSDWTGRNDDLMRLVQIRDLAGGQGWFDLHQLRMGAEGGFAMHWSRIVDAPVALLILAFGETLALVLWPALLFTGSVLLVLRIARNVFGPAARFPAMVIGTITLYASGLFSPGALDHHNLQLTLALALLAGLVAGGMRGGIGAGTAAALMLAVGAESLPLVAAGGLSAAGLWLLRGAGEQRLAAGYGLSFGALGLAALAATVAPHALATVACDAFSGAQAGLGALAGFGLAALVGLTKGQSLAKRVAGACALGAAYAGAVLAVAPQCLADPYAGLDPRLARYWLSAVGEAQSVRSVWNFAPALFWASYATPVLALLVIARRVMRNEAGRGDALVGALLCAAFLMSLWQVRGAMFALPLAALPLAGFVADARMRAELRPSIAASLVMTIAWLASMSVVWAGAAKVAVAALAGEARHEAAHAEGMGPSVPSACYGSGDYAQLASLPATTVLAVSNLGPAVLAFTQHRVLAGPYHRNVAGNLAALEAWLGRPEQALALIRRHGVGIVAACPGNDETAVLAGAAPGSFLATLNEGAAPAWLEPVPATSPLRLYRVQP